MKKANYELEVWTCDGEFNVFFDNYDDAQKEYDLAAAEFGETNVMLHDYSKVFVSLRFTSSPVKNYKLIKGGK